MPALYFQLAPCIYIVYFQKRWQGYLHRLFSKGLRQGVQDGQGCPWFHAAASFSREKLVVEQCTRMYTVQQRKGL
ncbi:hypothetical protein ABH09_02065 [Treponema sp. OMZ 803]|uniref:hypothetical protein n=1 Tax=Treponema sp. OMZ 803 TaxID=120682 RepID=UPI0020A35733|nr:hypothetical protein [Treponema sp. OMZ 803]UTC53476.1 hypothetical protein ABH09_02065 [Treponema sp. OMZ 803]